MRIITQSLALAAGLIGWQALALDPDFEAALRQKYDLEPAPSRPARPLLKAHDRLAICGDSITEQKMYSRIIEDYLTMCAPQLGVAVRQYGWSGEKARGFLLRMTNDCLRFKPTIATTCYGMNDHEYRTYEPRIGDTYRSNTMAIIEAFKAHGVRVIQGSPGCVGKVPGWQTRTNETVDDLNRNLAVLRNIGLEAARQDRVGFADVFWPMIRGGTWARETYGPDYAIAGKDGVHPGWAGQLVMAYAFLEALGVDGNLARFDVNLSRNTIKVSTGHKVVSSKNGVFEITSSRYPFCLCAPAPTTANYPVCASDDVTKDNSLRSAATLVPFNQELNRFMLKVRNAKAKEYTVRWGKQARKFSVEQLSLGINLAAEFPENPFSEQFARVDAAVLAKQAYETKQVKEFFRGIEAKNDMEGVVARTERERAGLVQAVKETFKPVTYTLSIVAEK